MGMMNEEREKHIRIANMLIGAINDLNRPMIMYQIEKDVAKEALKNYIKMLEQQPCDDCISRAEAINVVHKYFMDYLKLNDDICLDGIRSLPSVTPTISKMEQVEDCISRYAVDELSKELVHTTRDKADFLCNFWERLQKLPPVTPSIPDVENDFNLGYNCGYADAMNDIAESEK